jgi:phytoene dehydrogenase-like protein
MSQFVVIGGGIAGLTAANTLASTGAKVRYLSRPAKSGAGRGREETTIIS